MVRRLLPAFALAAAVMAGPAHADAERATFFVIDAIKADNGEIANGTLAQQRASSAAVRDFGATLVRDHTDARAQAIAAAQQVGVGTPTDMPPEAARLNKRLMRLTGTKFDQAFLTATIKQYRKLVARYDDQAHGGDEVTKKLASDALPKLQMHLTTALSLR